VATIGQTGTGKSTLLAWLLRRWSYLIALQTKSDSLTAQDYDAHLIRRAAQLDDTHYTRFLLKPRYQEQRREIALALDRPWRNGEPGWTIDIDELFYIQEKLNLGELVDRLLTQGRSESLTTVVGMQRPARISRFAISQSTHVLAFGMEGRDAKLLSEATTPSVQEVVEQLEQHEFLWFYRPTRALWIGKLDLRTGQLIETAHVERAPGVSRRRRVS
jgi:hypothetical protein